LKLYLNNKTANINYNKKLSYLRERDRATHYVFTHYEDIKGDTKCKKITKIALCGVVRVTQGH